MPAPVVLVWQADGGTDRLRLPSGLAVARDGTVTVVDAGNNRLVRLSGSGQVLARLGRTGQAHGEFLFTTPPDVGEGAAFGLVGGGVAVDGEGGFFVTDYNARVQRFDRDGQFVTAWGDRPPTVGRFIEPFAVAVADRQGRVYVADRLAHCIHAFDRDGRWLLAWGELGTAGGQFIGPVAVAVDRQGQVYVADRGNDRIQTFDGNGRFLTAWGGPGRQPGEFAGPVGVAVDGQGHVFVATAHKILVFSATGIFLSAWDDTSVAGSFVAGGIAVDQHGDIYVTDAARGSILRFRPRGPWPTPSAAHPTPRPAMPTATPPPPMSPTPPPFMTPTDR